MDAALLGCDGERDQSPDGRAFQGLCSFRYATHDREPHLHGGEKVFARLADLQASIRHVLSIIDAYDFNDSSAFGDRVETAAVNRSFFLSWTA